ncbi:ROK-family transcriptional regulator [Halanaerobium saccharolyticum subsp. saccharolyticum DSM 6643]|uniref:ROK-family transcriptional regulator n=1 Tax=Halanaerobium saccharolyticum subsp. saccharolyticum DSM 6643 TaxID=1293054 RepID=M5E3J3_9FIRM|nr:ROK family transcriptional regulator [Halanaerobium saccharolyticum]CCU80866.1 ROK-family transcriptional regulator [Halanaerobium saccharolyticum subsp. saccharolyticum DSM 6643]
MSRIDSKKFFGWSGPAAGAAIFRIIKNIGPLSRTDIVKKTGLSKSTVSVHTKKLLEMGLIKEAEAENKSVGSVGRNRQLLKFAKNNGVIVAIDLGATSLNVGLCNLDAEIIDMKSKKTLVNNGPKIIMEEIDIFIEKLLESNEIADKKIFGIGMGVPGPVEFSKGTPVSPPIMPGWHLFPLKKVLQQKYSCPAFIDNDVNVMAVGEKHAGLAQNISNFIFIKIGTGIGAGIICEDELYRGSKGCAGDIGHIAVEGEQEFCPCGNRGCLEVVAAGPAIAKKAKIAAQNKESEILLSFLNIKGELTAEDVGEAVKRNDKASIDIIKNSGQKIGQVVSRLVNFYNPSLIIIGGGVANLGNYLISSIKEEVLRHSTSLAVQDLEIELSQKNEEVAVIGAAAMAVNEIYSHDNVTEMVYLDSGSD